MMNKLISIIAVIMMSLATSAQSDNKDRGNMNVHFGTIMIYNTYSFGYESFNVLKNTTKHQIRPTLRIGGWNSNILTKNSGSLSTIGVTYLFGGKNHFFEHSSEFVSHFDRGLKDQFIVYIGSTYRPFFGYRYQPEGKKILLRFGFGWREVVQLGFGYRI